jgi:hypothetical protein
MKWISAADLAQRNGVSRAAVTKAISSGRIPADAVRRAGGRVLIEESAGMKGIQKRANVAPAVEHQAPPQVLQADVAELASLFAWGAAPAAAEKPTAEPPASDCQMLQRELSEALWREQEWIQQYKHFRDFVTGWSSPGYTIELLKAIPDPAPAGDVMQNARRILLEQMKDLDRCDLRSRFPTVPKNQRAHHT